MVCLRRLVYNGLHMFTHVYALRLDVVDSIHLGIQVQDHLRPSSFRLAPWASGCVKDYNYHHCHRRRQHHYYHVYRHNIS